MNKNIINDYKDIPIYIIHYKKLINRKEYLDNALRKEGFTNIHWVDSVDRDTMTQEQKDMYKYSEESWYALNATWKHFQTKPRLMTPGEIACTVSHIFIYKEIVETNTQYALVFEDDAILLPKFRESLKSVLDELLAESFDVCYLGDAFGWTVGNFKHGHGYLGSLNNNTVNSERHVYPMNSSKCAESFLISNNCAKVFYKNFVPFCLPPDWMHTPIIIQNSLKCFWAEPCLVHQGSVDVYSSSVGRD